MKSKEVTFASIARHMSIVEQGYEIERDSNNLPKAYISAYTHLGLYHPEMVFEWARTDIGALPVRESYIDIWLKDREGQTKTPEEIKRRQHQILIQAFEQAYYGREDLEEDPTGSGGYTNELLTAHLRLAEVSGSSTLPIAEQLYLLTFARVSSAQVQLVNWHERYLPIFFQIDKRERFTIDSIWIGGGVEYAQSHLKTALKWADLETEVSKIEPARNEEADQMLTQVYTADKQLTLFDEYTSLLAGLGSKTTKKELYRFGYYDKAKAAINKYMRLAHIRSERLLANLA